MKDFDGRNQNYFLDLMGAFPLASRIVIIICTLAMLGDSRAPQPIGLVQKCRQRLYIKTGMRCEQLANRFPAKRKNFSVVHRTNLPEIPS